MKKIIFIFFTLSFLLFIGFVDKVYAKEVIPYFSSINNEVFSEISKAQNVSESSSITSDTTFDLTIRAVSFGDMNFTNYPYVLLYFYSNNANLDTSSVFSLKQTSSCNQSCFNYFNLSIVNLGTGQYNGSSNYRYVMILPVQKIYEDPSQSDDPVTEVTGSIRLSTTASYVYFRFTNFILADSSSIENNSYKDFNSIISSATTNTQNIINSQNSNTQSIINNQNQNQQQTNQKLDDLNNNITNDSIQSGTGSDFFNDFSTTDNGGISGILTAPLVAINSMLDNTCVPLTATYKGKEISLPCGTQFWSSMGSVKDYLSLLESGILCYAIIKAIFELIHNLKDPDNDKVEVMSL